MAKYMYVDEYVYTKPTTYQVEKKNVMYIYEHMKIYGS